MKVIKRHHSPKGLPLACHRAARNRSILSIELSEASPGLFLIHPSGHVFQVSYEQLKAYADMAQMEHEALWPGDTFDPRHFNALAAFLGAIPCGISLQILMGRWVLKGRETKPGRKHRKTATRKSPSRVWFPARPQKQTESMEACREHLSR